MVMKYVRWVEARVFTIPDRKLSLQDEANDTNEDIKKKSLPLIQNPFLPIASAFSSPSFPVPSSTQPVITEPEPQCDGPLISRPRPIAPSGTEKSFFSRGTIPTENITLPTRIHSKYRPSYSQHKEDVEEKSPRHKLSGREQLLNIITELYPNVIKSVTSRSHRKYGSSDSSNTPTSINFKSNFSQTSAGSITGSSDFSLQFSPTIPTYANLPTPPLSPLKSTEHKTISFDNFAKDSNDGEDQEFSRVRSFLISFLNIKGNQLPRHLHDRIMECFSISPSEIVSEKSAPNMKDEKEMHEKSVKMLVRALIYQIPESLQKAVQDQGVDGHAQTKSLTQSSKPAPEMTEDYLAPNFNFNSQTTRAHKSETHLAKYQPKHSNSELPSLLKIPNSVMYNRKMPSLNLKKNIRDVFSR